MTWPAGSAEAAELRLREWAVERMAGDSPRAQQRQDDVWLLLKSHASLAARVRELDELQAIINADGSLTTDEDHRDIARDAMHALGRLGQIDARDDEITALQARVRELEARERTALDAHAGPIAAPQGSLGALEGLASELFPVSRELTSDEGIT